MTEIPDNLKSAMEQYANIKVELENDAELEMLQALIDNLMIDVNATELKIQELNSLLILVVLLPRSLGNFSE